MDREDFLIQEIGNIKVGDKVVEHFCGDHIGIVEKIDFRGFVKLDNKDSWLHYLNLYHYVENELTVKDILDNKIYQRETFCTEDENIIVTVGSNGKTHISSKEFVCGGYDDFIDKLINSKYKVSKTEVIM